MKKTLFALLLAPLSLFAQTGISQNAEGIRVPAAFTLPQGSLYIASGLEITSDGEPLALGGHYKTDGEVKEIGKKTNSSVESLHFNYGILDNLEGGLLIPINHDGKVGDTRLDGAGIGDIEFRVKGSMETSIPLQLAAAATIYAPTGTRGSGFKPRHVWYIHKEKSSYAYTSNAWAVSATGFATFHNFEFLHWNSYLGYLKDLGYSDDALLWGTGLSILPHKMLSLMLELSGETRIVRNGIPLAPQYDPLRFTAGLRLHLPKNLSISAGGDFGIGNVLDEKEEDALPVKRRKNGKELSYSIPGSPKTTINVSLSKTFDFSWKDSDHDGIIDRHDLCQNSPRNSKVNQRGCPVDEDQDGVLNIIDDCPETPLGVYVDYNGCPIDSDEDGIPDYMDMCDNTAKGVAVDSKGCMLDSDNDGIDDNNDKCPDTPRGEKTDENGCPLDADHDGVLNDMDLCEDTPFGISVDRNGCPLDFDKDGIPDDLDNCPNSAPNEIVDAQGCSLDSDNDGVPDSRDECPNTPPELAVTSNGCLSDRDNDGVPDVQDKCPNTSPNIPVDSTGCNLDTDKDGIPDYLDKCPNTFANVKVDNSGCPIDKAYNLESISKRILFSPKTNKIHNSSYTALNDIIFLMRKYKLRITIQCGKEYQANAITNYMESKGFLSDKVNVQIKEDSGIQIFIQQE